MGVTIDTFKQAFKTTSNSGLYDRRKNLVQQEITALETAIGSLRALHSSQTGVFEGEHTALGKTLERLDELAVDQPRTAYDELIEVKDSARRLTEGATQAVTQQAGELRKAAEQAVKDTEGHENAPWLVQELIELRKAVLDAETAYTGADMTKAYNLWSKIPGDATSARSNPSRKKAFEQAKEQAQKEIDKLTNHKQKKDLATPITEAGDKLKEADDKVKSSLIDDAFSAAQAAKQKAEEGLVFAGKLDQLDAARQKADEAIKAIKKHKLQASFSLKIGEAETKLTEADNKRLTATDDAINAAKAAEQKALDIVPLADGLADYRVERGKVMSIVLTLVPVAKDFANPQKATIENDADPLADPPTCNFVEAKKKLAEVLTTVSGLLEQELITNLKPKVKALDTLPGVGALGTQVTGAKDLFAEVVKHQKAGRWVEVLVTGKVASSQVTAVTRLAARRDIFEKALEVAKQAIEKVRSAVLIKPKVDALDLEVVAAETMAQPDKGRIEEGTVKAKGIEVAAKDLEFLAGYATQYTEVRTEVLDLLSKLEKHPAVAEVSEAIAGVRKLVDEAAELAKGLDFRGAHKQIFRASVDLEVVEAQADGLKTSSAIKGEAAKATDAEAIRQAIEKIRKQSKDLGSSTHGALITDEVGHIKDSCDESEYRLGQNQPDIAAIPLNGAAAMLVEAERVIALQTEYVERKQPITEELSGVASNTRASKVKAPIQEVRDALTQADELAAGRSYPEAFAKLREASAAVARAGNLIVEREEFDKRAKEISLKQQGLSNGTPKTEAGDLVTNATNKADEIKLKEAHDLLDDAEAKIESITVDDKARNDPTSVALVDSAKKMMKAPGGAKMLDKLVAALPDTVDKSVLEKLMKERFGFDFEVDAGAEVISAQKMWSLMAKVPDRHAKNNPSLKKVRRETPGDEGGYYSGAEDLIVMNGRPDTSSPQKFGSQLGELPNDVETDCEPVNEDEVPYFDFATLHEVGHAVDDRLQFMNSRLGNTSFGGWQTYSSIEAVAKIVAAGLKYDEAWVLSVMRRNPAEPPKAPGGREGDWDACKQAVEDWFKAASTEGVWWSQPKSATAAVDGVVYQEAYGGTWVSYPLDQRKKGLTGYQFRAPGEWFAELYAGFHSGKLKPSHPAANWLKGL